MNYLLDTHTFIWFVEADRRLSRTSLRLIQDPENQIFLSVASVWEMAIKISVGKLRMPLPYRQFVESEIEKNEFILLGISTEHAEAIAHLDYPASGHRDPFDRLLVAQSLCEDLPIISRDNCFRHYHVEKIW